MKRIRLMVVAALAVSSLGIAAAPASACDPETRPCCPNDDPVNRLWEKLTGDTLIRCPWA
ncbi:MAG TPA: hypothetical protein VEU29_04620 [Actinomycetota bacterium]|nr:hypothetical protein [Actinomycetota bacterium]